MKNILYIILLVAISQQMASQETLSKKDIEQNPQFSVAVKEPLSDGEVKHAAELYNIMMQTTTYKAAENARREFTQKKPPKERPKEVEEFRKMIIWKLSETKFESVDEAVRMYQKLSELYEKQGKENAELYSLIPRASAEQIRVIFAPEFARAKQMMD